MGKIPEKDWKQLRTMKDKKLNQACEAILNNVESEIKNKGNENHKSYLKVWKIIDSGDDGIAEMFNDLKRSNAISKLVAWKRNGLLTENDLKKFSEGTRSTIEALAKY